MITHVEIQNFLVFGHVSIDFPQRGLYLVEGSNGDEVTTLSNGAGKSSFFHAIIYANYGKSYKSLAVGDLTNRFSTGGMMVSVTHRIAGNEYVIIRSRGHKEHGTGLKLFLNGVDQTTHVTGDMQAYIEKNVLPISYSAFVSSSYIDGNMSGTFGSLNDSNRKSVLENLFGVPDTSRYEQQCKHEIAQYEARNNTINGNMTQLNNNEISQKALLEKLNGNLLELHDEWKKEQDAFKASIVSAQEAMNRAIAEHMELNTIYEAKVAEIPPYEENYNAWVAYRDGQFQVLSTLTANGASARKTVEKYTDLIAKGICPHCEGGVTTHSHEVLNEAKAALENISAEYRAVKEAYDKAVSEVVNITKVLSDMKSVRDSQFSALNNVSRKIKELESSIALIENSMKAGTMETAKRSIENSIAAVTLTLENIGISRNKFIEEQEELIRNTDDVRIIAKKIFSPTGVRSKFLSFYINQVNKILAEILFSIGDNDITAQLVLDAKDKIIIDITNGVDSYNSLSDGQRRYLDFALQLSIYKLRGIADSPFLVIDESLSTIDNTRVSSILNYLSDMAHTHPIFLVTHNAAVKQYVNNVITVSRKNSVSTVEITQQ